MEVSRVKHLTKRYGQGETQVGTLDDVPFCVEQGEFVATIRPNGSDKSTLLYLLGGVDRPVGGKAYVGDRDMYALDETALAIFRKRQIDLVYQLYNLIPVPSVKESITLPLLPGNHSVNTQQLDGMVETLRLKKRLQHLSSQLGNGQWQRVPIGRTLMASPAIVLTDKPTRNLDRANNREIISLLKRLHDELHQTLVVITHDKGIALQVDRTLKTEDGHIVYDEMIHQ